MEIQLEEELEGVYTLKVKNQRGKEGVAVDYLIVQKAKIVEGSKQKGGEWEILMRSTALPGWGQIYSGNKYDFKSQRIRGYLYSSLFVFALLQNQYLKDRSQKLEKEMNREFTVGILAGAGDLQNGGDGIASLLVAPNLIQKKSEGENMVTRSKQMNQLILGVYLIQWVDAFFINKKRNDSESLQSFEFGYEKGNFFQAKDEQFLLNYRIRF